MTVGFGMTFVIVGGGIDLSVGSVLALSGIIGATIAVSLNPILGLFISILVGLICGLVNGFIFSFLRIPSFIVTLGMLQMARGVTTIYSKGFPVMMPREIIWMGSWPGIFILAIFSFAIVSFLFNFTKIGEFDRAIGGNETVAEMSGVPVTKYKVIPFIISGCFAGLGGFIMAARLGVASPTIGVGYELDVIASVVLGGTPLTGGVGNVYGTIIGAIIMSTIGNGLVIMGVPSEWQLVVKGIILIGAVFISIDRAKIGKIK
jgi:ribose/xylose/arabinose/galactoside ABC-type transport system permease subunit